MGAILHAFYLASPLGVAAPAGEPELWLLIFVFILKFALVDTLP